MIVLHGIWGRAEDSKWYFYLWGETSVDNDKAVIIKQRFSFRHPFNASNEELHKVAKVTSSFSTIELVLPTFKKQKKPQPSTPLLGQVEYGNQLRLNKWVVDCLVIDSADAMIYLKNIDEHLDNHDISYGDDLVFWSEVAKFSLDLLIRQRFIPSIQFSEHLLHDDNRRRKYWATWVPIINDIKDSHRLKLLEESMPPVCRALNSRILPRQLLLNVLQSSIDGSIRRFLQEERQKILNDIVAEKVSDDYHGIDIEWLEALLSTDMEINSPKKSIESVAIELNRWSDAVSSHESGQKFITCFRLEPPALDGDNGNNNNNDRHVRNTAKWKLNYLLQAVDDPSLVIEADKVWKSFKGKKGENKDIGKYLDRRFQHPQDRLLADLAVASRLFKPIERSLKSPAPSGCLIDVNEANSFLTESVWLFRESGYVILLPSWWNAKQNSLGVNVTLKSESVSFRNNRYEPFRSEFSSGF